MGPIGNLTLLNAKKKNKSVYKERRYEVTHIKKEKKNSRIENLFLFLKSVKNVFMATLAGDALEGHILTLLVRFSSKVRCVVLTTGVRV